MIHRRIRQPNQPVVIDSNSENNNDAMVICESNKTRTTVARAPPMPKKQPIDRRQSSKLTTDQFEQARELNKEGDAHFFKTFDVLEALRCYQSAADIVSPYEPDNIHLSFYFNNVGLALEKLGRFEESVYYHERALKIRRLYQNKSTSYKLFTATSWNNAGLVYTKLRRTNRAQEYLQKARGLVEKYAPDSSRHAMILSNLAEVYHEQGRTDDALDLCDKALAMEKAVDKKAPALEPTLAFIVHRTGVILDDVPGREADALRYLAMATVSRQACMPGSVDMAQSCLALGRLMLEEKNLTEAQLDAALNHLRTALEVFEKFLPDSKETENTRYLLRKHM